MKTKKGEMKILHVITSLGIGGAEKLMVDMLPRMRAMGHDVEALVFDGTPSSFMHSLESHGIMVHKLHAHGGIYTPTNVLRLVPYMRRYDVIHTHNTACQLYVPIARLLAWSGAKLVTTEHNTTNRRREMWYFKPIDRWMYARYSQIISISDKASMMLDNHIQPQGLTTIENGIELENYFNAKPCERNLLVPEYAEGNVIIAMVAGFREQKDHDCAIRALQELPGNYKLCLVGEGERRGEIERLISELHLENRVRLMGLRSDVPQILRASDVNLLASHWEGLSLSSVEGMASGRPFIASDVNGLREVVSGHGLLFDDGDSHQLAEVIRRVTTDKAEYERVGKACALAARQYDIADTARKYCDVYEQICRKD